MVNFNGVDLSTIVKINDIKRPILPPMELTTFELPDRPGAIVVKKRKKPFYIEVKITIESNGLTDLRNKARNLADVLDTDELSSVLFFSDEPDKFVMAELDGSTDLDEICKIGKGTILFFVPDPYWYAFDDDVFIYDEPGEYVFERKGTAPSFPLIEIQGINTSGSITIENESTTMKYTGQLLANETLFLDTELTSAYIKNDDEIIPVMDKLDNLDFPVLKKGENHLSVITSGGATISNVKITCRSRWK